MCEHLASKQAPPPVALLSTYPFPFVDIADARQKLYASAEGVVVVPVEGALLPKHRKRGLLHRVWVSCVEVRLTQPARLCSKTILSERVVLAETKPAISMT